MMELCLYFMKTVLKTGILICQMLTNTLKVMVQLIENGMFFYWERKSVFLYYFHCAPALINFVFCKDMFHPLLLYQ